MDFFEHQSHRKEQQIGISQRVCCHYSIFCSVNFLLTGIQCKLDIQERIKDKIVLNPNSIIPKIEQSRKSFLITKWRETNI